MGTILITLGVPVAVIFISHFLYLGFHDSDKESSINIKIAAILLLLCCGSIIIATVYGLGIVGYIQFLLGSSVAFFSGIFLTFMLNRWKKVIGLVFAVGIPLVLYASFEAAFPYSPDQVIRRNGEEIIVKALNEYHNDNKAYPQNLSELVPVYVNDLQEPKSIWGWLYTGNNEDFTLGYVTYIDKLGYSICKYSASSPKWECPLDYSTAPFAIPPTPVR